MFWALVLKINYLNSNFTVIFASIRPGLNFLVGKIVMMEKIAPISWGHCEVSMHPARWQYMNCWTRIGLIARYLTVLVVRIRKWDSMWKRLTPGSSRARKIRLYHYPGNYKKGVYNIHFSTLCTYCS